MADQPKNPLDNNRGRRTVTLKLAEDLFVETDGSTTYIDLVLPTVLTDVGYYVEDVTIHAYLPERSGDAFQYRVVMEYSFDKLKWEDIDPPLLNDVNSLGYKISEPFDSRDELGRHLRFVLGVCNSQAGSAVSGRISLQAAIRFWS